MKKIILVFGVLAIFMSATVPVVGAKSILQTTASVKEVDFRPVPLPEPIPTPVCRDIQVTPDNPVRLSGKGKIKGHGKGNHYFNIKQGKLGFRAHGILALKVSENDKVRSAGFRRHLKVGDWDLYLGDGKLLVKGDDYEVIGFGKFSLLGKGTGSVSFEGNWKLRVCSLRKIEPRPIPVNVIPLEFKAEFVK